MFEKDLTMFYFTTNCAEIYGDISRRMGSAAKWLSPNADGKAAGDTSVNTNDDASDTEKVVSSAMKSYAPTVPASYKGVSTVPLPYKGPGPSRPALDSPSKKGRGRPSEGRTQTRHNAACQRCGRTFASRKGLAYHLCEFHLWAACHVLRQESFSHFSTNLFLCHVYLFLSQQRLQKGILHST